MWDEQVCKPGRGSYSFDQIRNGCKIFSLFNDRGIEFACIGKEQVFNILEDLTRFIAQDSESSLRLG